MIGKIQDRLHIASTYSDPYKTIATSIITCQLYNLHKALSQHLRISASKERGCSKISTHQPITAAEFLNLLELHARNRH